MSNGRPTDAERTSAESQAQFVQYLFLKVDAQWRRLDEVEREEGRADFVRAVCDAKSDVTTYSYSTLGLKVGAEVMLWWKATSPDAAQQLTSKILQTGLGRYCEISHSLWGFTRPSVYTKRRSAQEHALDEPTRLRYLIVYPFVKTIDWYLMSRDVRQGMMNEHMRIGHDFEDVRQVLLYTTGLDDQEFIVAYEADRLERHQELVIALRSTEARRYTLRDTPIFTAIYRPLEEALALVG
ncbi:MAG: chlorite dismutase family protein [Gemmatimonadaceae bacterium]